MAIAAATLPMFSNERHAFAVAVWVAAALLLVGVSIAVAAHWLRHPRIARGHHRDPPTAQFYGAPPMALMTTCSSRVTRSAPTPPSTAG